MGDFIFGNGAHKHAIYILLLIQFFLSGITFTLVKRCEYDQIIHFSLLLLQSKLNCISDRCHVDRVGPHDIYLHHVIGNSK